LVAAKISCQGPLEMTSIQNDEVVQTFPSDGPDQTLRVAILPRTLCRRGHCLDPQRLQTPGNFRPINAIPTSDQKARLFPIGGRYDDLLRYHAELG